MHTMEGRNRINYYLQLLEVFTFREIKSRYKASILGFAWIIIYPLTMALILNVIFGQFIRIDTGYVPYFLFVFSGIVFWNYFQQSIYSAKDSLIWNSHLVTKSNIPKIVIPLSYVLSKVPDFFVYSLILIIFCILNGFKLELIVLFLFLSLIPLFLFTVGISLITSVSNAVFRDFGKITELFLLIIFYATPIVYPEKFIPENFKFILYLNPLSLSIVFARDILFNHKIQADMFLLSIVFSLLIFLLGILFFKKYEKVLPDLI
jgi:lipopolysaccharide transport system permease protein